jgi:hypothetical protein
LTEKVIIFYSNRSFRDVTRQKKKTRFFVTLRRKYGRRADTDLVRFSRNMTYYNIRLHIIVYRRYTRDVRFGVTYGMYTA